MTVEEMLAAARARIRRLTPAQADDEVGGGALLVDIRPAAQRAAHGEVPAAVVMERNVLEWRLDPHSDARLPRVEGHGHQIVVMCQEGYTSSLAAAALVDLGFADAADLDGGFQAWKDAGLPITPAVSPPAP